MNNVLVRNRANTNSGALSNVAMKSPFVLFEITLRRQNETVHPLPDEYKIHE